MRNDAYELVRVQRHQALTGEFGIDIGRVGDAERIVRVDGDDLCVGADEFAPRARLSDHTGLERKFVWTLGSTIKLVGKKLRARLGSSRGVRAPAGYRIPPLKVARF